MSEQMTLLDVAAQPQPKRISAGAPTARPAPSSKHAETPAEKALRFRREAAEIRRELRDAAIKDDLR